MTGAADDGLSLLDHALNAMLMLNVVPVLVFGIEASLGRSFAPIELVGAAVVIGALVANNLYLRGVSKK